MEINLKKVNKKTVLKGLTLPELRDYFVSIDEPAFRAEQVFDWMYDKRVDNFEQMRNIPKSLLMKLKESGPLKTLTYNESEMSEITGTKKFIFETVEANKIESVLIPESRRLTLCVSTQVGCPLDCKFCATGLMGYKKNLSAGEIFDQYKLTQDNSPENKITNMVYMGMGEPLLNFKETVKSLQIFAEDLLTGMSLKKITVSTAGIAPKIRELADTGLKARLALSLHSCFDEIRTKIMPINKKYSLKENLAAVRYYSKTTGTRITFEYVMLKDLNDRDEDISDLTKLCRSLPSKLNVIPFNSLQHMNPGGLSAKLQPTAKERIEEFVRKLRENNITVMVRNTQGDDIAAACGQLAIKFQN